MRRYANAHASLYQRTELNLPDQRRAGRIQIDAFHGRRARQQLEILAQRGHVDLHSFGRAERIDLDQTSADGWAFSEIIDRHFI